MSEPGKGGSDFARLSISLKRDDEAELMRLKHHLEAKSGVRLSVSEVVRRGVKCLSGVEGL